MKRVKTENGEEVIHVCQINTAQVYRNETIFCAEDQFGKPIFLNFNTMELLEWLDVERMKEQSIKHINEL